jgi:hypothetical protein
MERLSKGFTRRVKQNARERSPFRLAGIALSGKKGSVRAHHGQWSWLTPKCPNLGACWPRRGPMSSWLLSVVHSCKVILPLELLAADNFQRLNRVAICAFHSSLIDTEQNRSLIG